MSGLSMGDLAQSYMLQRRNADLKQQMMQLTNELASGQIADIRQVLDGNYGHLTEITRQLETLSSYGVATTEATLFASGVQTALSRVEELGKDLSLEMLVTGTTSAGTNGSDMAKKAEQTLRGLVGALNTEHSGRNLFSGTATNRPPLASADLIMEELRSAMAGATAPDDMISAAKNWFADPAGFASVIYQGSSDDLAPFALSDGENVNIAMRADDPTLRDMIRQAAISALASDPAFGLSGGAQSELFTKTATEMIGTHDGVISMRARIGFTEARIDTVTARNAATLTSLNQARNALVATDPYETATNLENVQFQLQSLYSVTVRMSQLSLVNFL